MNDNGVSRERDKRADRAIWIAFTLSLIAMPPLNKYVTAPFFGDLLNAPDSMAAWILGGAATGGVFAGIIWLIRKHLKS
jgi:hypothetical protein